MSGKSFVRGLAMIMVVAGVIGLMVTFILKPNSTATANPASASVAANHTITFIVTGHSDVTYNDGYHAVQAKGPFHITMLMKPGRNYSVATLNTKPGNSACEIKVDGKTVAARRAFGEANTAGCVVVASKSSYAASTW